MAALFTDTPAWDDTIALMMRQRARRIVMQTTKDIARRYRREPMQLDRLLPGLCAAPAAKIIAAGEHFLEAERTTARRHMGFGGEVPALNARGARLYGRWLRRFGDRLEQAA